MEKTVPGWDVLLHLRGGHPRQYDAVVVAEIDQRIAMRIGGDERLQFLDGLHIGKVVELDRILLRIEVRNGVGTDARRENEMVVAVSADRNRDRLVFDW